MRTVVLIACVVTALAISASAAQAAPAAAGPVVHLYAPNHHPRVGHPWRIRITATTTAGRPLRAEVRYQFLYGGQVVARRSHYRFRGTFRDNIEWTAPSVGLRLTFRAVVKTPLGTRNLDWWVVPRR